MEKIICSNCKTPFYLVKNNTNRICPNCKYQNLKISNKTVLSTSKKNKYEGRVQLINKSNLGTELVFANQGFNSKGITSEGFYFLPSTESSISKGNHIKIKNFPLNGFINYLAGPHFKNIGTETAKKIVNNKKCLSLISKKFYTEQEIIKDFDISEKIAKSLFGYLKFSKTDHILNIILRELGLKPATINEIIKQYGEKIITAFYSPYKLLEDVKYFSIEDVNNIISKLSLNVSEEEKRNGYLTYFLKQLENKTGNTSFILDKVYEKFKNEYDINKEDFLTFTEKSNSFFIEENLISTARSYTRDNIIAKRLAELIKKKSKPITIDLSIFEKKLSPSPSQIKSIEVALENPVSLITGGPGTGKTTIIAAIVNTLKKNNLKFSVTALTGKAAERIRETEGLESIKTSTLHRLIYKQEAEKTKKINDIIIIDECSMLDIDLMFELMAPNDSKSKIIFVGDADQLPSIGPGQVFKDLIDSTKIPLVELKENHRQKEGSTIIEIARDVIQSKIPDINKNVKQFEFISENNEDSILKIVLEKYYNIINDISASDIISKVKILAPMRKGLVGIHNLNRNIQNRLSNNNEAFKKSDEVSLFQQDLVIQNTNNYDLDLMNGEIGQILRADEYIIVADFKGEEKEFKGKERFQLDPAYALTIHKSQGSEYDTVIIPISEIHQYMLDPRLLYTAITRAKKKVIVVGNKNTFYQGIKTNWKWVRTTRLKDKILEQFN